TVHDAIPKRKRLIGQFHLIYVINRSGGFQIVECALFMPDAALTPYPAYKSTQIQYIAEMA
ncbi:hypothetical protein, partial [Escherichia coli]|uniref:hypothetical protein n=1 Tax=Escherichia coli TaxID=562 RepID=UPI00372CFBD7